MRTSGRGHDIFLIIPLGVVLAVALIFSGGPGGLAKVIDRFLGQVYNATAELVKAVF